MCRLQNMEALTYFNGQEYRVQAVKVESIIDTTGCGDSYHAGFVCSYMLENDIKKARMSDLKLQQKP